MHRTLHGSYYFVVNAFVVLCCCTYSFIDLSIYCGIDYVDYLHELASLPEKMKVTQEYWHICYYNRLATYNCVYYNNIHIYIYLNILSFDNSITSLITYHKLSMELKFMISLKVNIPIMTNYNGWLYIVKNVYPQQGEWRFLVHIGLVSCVFYR